MIHIRQAMDVTAPVIDYYEKNRLIFRWLWNSRRSYAIHFGYYDERATHHDAAVRRMNEVLADLAGIRGGERVLDAGCGLCGPALWLARERACEVTGVGLVEQQCREARRLIGRAGLQDKVTIVQADYNHTGFADESFDVVWALESHCHTADKARFYREAYRLLRPGGRLVMADLLRDRRPLAPDEEDLLQQGLRRWAIPDLDTADEHRRHAREAGFTIMQITNINERVRRSLQNAYEHARRWRSLAHGLYRIGLVNEAQWANTEGTRYQYQSWERGLWYYALLSFRKS